MNTVVIQPAVTLRQPAPVRIPVPAEGALQGDTLVLVDLTTGERIPAQRDGEKAVIAVVSPLSGERRFRIETAAGMRMLCGVRAGIQIAKCGGISQNPGPEAISITPRVA